MNSNRREPEKDFSFEHTCLISRGLIGISTSIIIIIIISIFKEDNVFSMIARLSYGPPVNTDIGYYRTFFVCFFVSAEC